jgi:hypothetical protein
LRPSLTNLIERMRARAKLAMDLAAYGHHDRAKMVADTIPDPGERYKSLAMLAWAAGKAGEHRRAADLVAESDDIDTRTIPPSTGSNCWRRWPAR